MERPGSRNISLEADLAAAEGGKYENVVSGFVMRNVVNAAALPKHFCKIFKGRVRRLLNLFLARVEKDQ